MSRVDLQFLGQAGFRIRCGETELWLDPYLSDSVARVTGDPERWGRRFPPPVEFDEMRGATALLLTHEHLDHTDRDTVEEFLRRSPEARIVGPAPACDLVADLTRPELITHTRGELDGPDFGPLRIRSVPAAHSDSYGIERDERGHRWQGFLIETDELRIYHAGDTAPFDELVPRVLERGPVDVAILPINGRDPARLAVDVVGNLWPREAADIAAELGVATLIPAHYDLFEWNGIPAGQLVDYVTAAGLDFEVRVPAAGGWTSFLGKHDR